VLETRSSSKAPTALRMSLESLNRDRHALLLPRQTADSRREACDERAVLLCR
jgi:hypothetical protein